MQLEIDDNKTIGDLQEKFNECFPYLRLEFFSRAHGWHGHSLSQDSLAANITVGSITKKHHQGVLTILSKQKVGEIEKAFKQVYGLFVQVFYQANDCWFETRDTDDLTLEQLCCMAEKEDLQY